MQNRFTGQSLPVRAHATDVAPMDARYAAARQFIVTRAQRYRRDQMPSLDFRRSLTACGLALPPDDFIAWPTNHIIAFGLALACATLSGFCAINSSTMAPIAPRSVTCAIPRLTTSARGSPPSVHRISNKSLAILPEIVLSEISSMSPPSCAALIGEVAIA